MRIHRPVLATLAAALVVASCGSSGDSADPAPPDTAAAITTDAPPAAGGGEVGISGSRFGPGEIRIAAGETVTFTNDDPFAHTVTARDDAPRPFDSGNLGQGASFQVTFDEPGTYDYFCQIHPTMRATVVVG